MRINYEYHDVASSEVLENFTQNKVQHILKRSDRITGVDVYFKVNDAQLPHDRMTAGIRVELPGETLFAEAVNDEFQKSVAQATDELLVQLEKYKAKSANH